MKIVLASVSGRRGGLTGPMEELLTLYTKRASQYCVCEHRVFATEAKLLDHLDDSSARTRPYVLIADSMGQQFTSAELAQVVTKAFDSGRQTLVVAIGPADGWSDAARKRADKAMAFGRITLPHELAAVVTAEQVYRALTIRAGHPYHSGH